MGSIAPKSNPTFTRMCGFLHTKTKIAQTTTINKSPPYGVPICLAGHNMDHQGIRYDNEKFI
ncbi:MAG: hypothetical protein ABW185_23540 [Sedimenticola sp.]